MIVATKIPNAIIKDNASYTLISPPPLKQEGKVAISMTISSIFIIYEMKFTGNKALMKQSP